VDFGARSRQGLPVQRQLHGLARAKSARLAIEEKSESARQRKLKQELEWVRASPARRQAKSKARLQAYEDLVDKSSKGPSDPTEIGIPPGPRLGDLVIEATNLKKGFGDRLLLDDLSFRLPRSGIVGIIGPNGAGKTTLFRMLVGEEKPDGGELKVGDTVKIAYVDQSRSALTGDQNVWQVISGGEEKLLLGKREVASRAYCGCSASRAATSKRRSARSRAGSATACTWPSS